MENEFVPLSEIVKKTGQPSAGKKYTTEELLNKEFVVQGVAFYQGGFGEYAIFYLSDGWYRSSSKVLIKQGKAIQAAIEQQKLKGVRVRLVKRVSRNKRPYLVFE